MKKLLTVILLLALLIPSALAEEAAPRVLVVFLSRAGENYHVGLPREGSASAAYAGYIEKGNTAIMFTQVANAPAKLIKEYKKEGIPALKAAYAEEGFYVGADKIEELATIKSKDEVLAEVVALLQSPVKNVVSALQSGASTIHGVLKTLGEREG